MRFTTISTLTAPTSFGGNPSIVTGALLHGGMAFLRRNGGLGGCQRHRAAGRGRRRCEYSLQKKQERVRRYVQVEVDQAMDQQSATSREGSHVKCQVHGVFGARKPNPGSAE